MEDVGGGGSITKIGDSAKTDETTVGKPEPATTVVRKPSRRSPTTGHRRKKTDFKRSQSSPREPTVPTSSDDEAQRMSARRRSLSPGPGPEPKKVLRRRHRTREKSQDAPREDQKSETTSVPETLKDPASKPLKGIIKSPSSDIEKAKVNKSSSDTEKAKVTRAPSADTAKAKAAEGSTSDTEKNRTTGSRSSETETIRVTKSLSLDSEKIRVSDSQSLNTERVRAKKPSSDTGKAKVTRSPLSGNGQPAVTKSSSDTERGRKDEVSSKPKIRNSKSAEPREDAKTKDKSHELKKDMIAADLEAFKDKDVQEKAERPNTWWGGWSPFKKKNQPKQEEQQPTTPELKAPESKAPEPKKIENKLEVPVLDDYITTDDEIAAEFVKILSQTKVVQRKPITRDVTIETAAKENDENAFSSSEKEHIMTWSQFIQFSRVEFSSFKRQFYQEVDTICKLRNRCCCEFLLIFIYCGCGAFIFKTTEGTFEQFYKCGVKRVKRDFIEDLWRSSHFMKEDDWKAKARSKLRDFEVQLQEAFDAGMKQYSGLKSWSFINGIIFSLTLLSTIGYGHIAPVTNSGRALTIAYSIIGIPLFLILLADFGKLFTRSMKFLWAFVRRLYYTGHCRKVRRTGPVQDMMKGMQMVVDTIRRPSMFPQEGMNKNFEAGGDAGTPGDPPSTPALSTFAIDDEFNLPISVAITILLIYIFMGATVFWYWEEDWSFFEAFYFVFISMSTIGFGDLVPKNQMYMMASIVYLAFGLALTSMCINVVQEKLSDSFRKASAKIGATIGLHVSEDDGTISPVSPTHVEIAEVHRPSPALSTKKVP